jgi:tripartite-type tricarboxylate transporter receptor subunit TctC
MRKVASLLFGIVLPFAAQAETYPSQSITVVVPFPAGGPSDIVARIMAEHMSKTVGQPMIIENVAGAGGTLGTTRVATARPDGYTLLAGSMGSHVSAPLLTPNVKYDPLRDFEPVGITAHSPAVILARKDFPAKGLREFVSRLRSDGDRIKQAHGGIGSSSHMACLLFASAAGVRPTLVAYRGVDQAVSNLAGGHVDYSCDAAVSASQYVISGTLRAYAVSANERLTGLSDVPTAREAGIDYQMSIWNGLFAPKGTPTIVVQRLAAALDKAQDDPAVRKRIGELGGTLPAKDERTPAKFAAFVNAEITLWSPMLKGASAEAK